MIDIFKTIDGRKILKQLLRNQLVIMSYLQKNCYLSLDGSNNNIDYYKLNTEIRCTKDMLKEL